jgi:hypothetical protein
MRTEEEIREIGPLYNQNFSEYLFRINHVLFKKFGKKVNGDIDWLDAVFVFAGAELAHVPAHLPDEEIIRLVRIGEMAFRQVLNDKEEK